MNRKPWHFTLTQAGLFACATYMAALIEPPWFSLLGWAVLGVAAIAAPVAPAKGAGLCKLAWAGALLALAGELATINRTGMDDYLALLAGQIALIVFITANGPGAGKTKSNWNALGLVWGFIGTAILLAVSYLGNLPGQFCLGLAAGLFLLILCRIWFRLGAFGIQKAD